MVFAGIPTAIVGAWPATLYGCARGSVLGCRRGTVGDGQLGTVESRTKLASICLGCFFQGGYSIVHSGSRMRADRVRHAIKLVQHQLPRRTIPLCLQGHRYRQRASKKSSAQPSGLPHTHCARHCIAVLCCAVLCASSCIHCQPHGTAVQCSAVLCSAVLCGGITLTTIIESVPSISRMTASRLTK